MPDGDRLLQKKQKKNKKKSKSPAVSPTSGPTKSLIDSPTSGPTGSPFPSHKPSISRKPSRSPKPSRVCNLPGKSFGFYVERVVEKVTADKPFVALKVTSDGGPLTVKTLDGTGECGLKVVQTAPGGPKVVCEQITPGSGNSVHDCEVNAPGGGGSESFLYDIVLLGSCENVEVSASNTLGDQPTTSNNPYQIKETPFNRKMVKS